MSNETRSTLLVLQVNVPFAKYSASPGVIDQGEFLSDTLDFYLILAVSGALLAHSGSEFTGPQVRTRPGALRHIGMV